MYYFRLSWTLLDYPEIFSDILGHSQTFGDIPRHFGTFPDILFRKSLLRSDLYCPCFFFFISSETASMIP